MSSEAASASTDRSPAWPRPEGFLGQGSFNPLRNFSKDENMHYDQRAGLVQEASIWKTGGNVQGDTSHKPGG